RYPGKFEYKSVYSSAGQTAFAGEVAQLRDYDFIYPTSIYGPQLAGFLKEAVARGYTGQFIQSGDNWWGFWEVIKGAMALSGLNGAISQSFYPIWTDDIPFITDAKARLLQQHPDEVDFQMAHTFWTSGEYYGMVLAEVIKKAIASVGAANITPTAMRDALADLQLDVTGWGVGTWSYGDTGILQKAFKMYKYNASEDKWYGISSWELPVSFTG
ncbi:MAG: hypothetical protein NTU41_05090, partial [Chloroflexi bacterium]|nr:hypothetical protein [Chloroflexota bacterium]